MMRRPQGSAPPPVRSHRLGPGPGGEALSRETEVEQVEVERSRVGVTEVTIGDGGSGAMGERVVKLMVPGRERERERGEQDS
ncbi:hypothetical protein EYF80_030420 [Liparis tanakae]|uniref:Uncharacterized protein n=1 Tax=Liparis tanakae TaxID=230148 RepID=A0A4Z2H283_9TELE|nr:hypothetical protein EYF80_030420 [Liparis tanakae]